MIYLKDELFPVFASKLSERSLLQTEINEPPKKEQGPIVMLIDSSSSMGRENRNVWTAACTLAFLEIAYKQQRAFGIIHFNHEIIDTKIVSSWENINRQELLESIALRPSGGTNFDKPLAKGVDIIKETGGFKEADLVMVTDGECNVDSDTINKAKEELNFSIYSILVGNDCDPDINKLFSDDIVHLKDAIRDDSEMHKIFQQV